MSDRRKSLPASLGPREPVSWSDFHLSDAPGRPKRGVSRRGGRWDGGPVAEREQPWTDDPAPRGRVLVLSDNPIARAIEAIATTAGRDVVVEPRDDGGPGLAPAAGDAVVLCDHDAPDAPAVLRAALASEAAYVAMMASRGRAAATREELVREGVSVDRLHVPAGLDIGGKAPGEIALSVVAEIVAVSHGRGGGPMRASS